MKKIYIVKTISTHEVTYAISSNKDLIEILPEVEMNINRYGPSELHQKWSGEKIQKVEGPYSEEEFIKIHDELYPQEADIEPEDKVFVVNYEKLHEIMLEDKDLL